ncbi:MAG: bifunctional oligoribonuclease/PAP phosphatase NrnA [Deltaproteobacteria bacterium]|nr:bifunctional oligoribonuclease/PAP phosphatase NrnA [Deltaproteobacteria bacterium]
MLYNIVDIIHSSKTFLVTSHVRLDGDALGSELALCQMLRNTGKEVVVYNQDETPDIYKFLPGVDTIVHVLQPDWRFDAAFILDCSGIDRVGDGAGSIISMSEKIVNIDHHKSNNVFTVHSLIDHEASSTGEIIYRVLTALGGSLNQDIATNIYTAIMTDTGSFRYSNTSSKTFELAAKLVEGGADLRLISELVYETRPLPQIRLMGMALDTLEFHENGTIGSVLVTQKMLRDAGALNEHTEGIVDMVRSVKGTDVALFYFEMTENDFKVSLRSKRAIDVASIAGEFGGGGHVNAAACRVSGDIETVKKRFVDVVTRALMAHQ